MSENPKRGLRDVATLRTRSSRGAPTSRPQAVSRFVLLENEKARLKRELEAWNVRKDTAEQKLAKVQVELAVLEAFLLGASPARSTGMIGRANPQEDSRIDPTSPTGVPFEY